MVTVEGGPVASWSRTTNGKSSQDNATVEVSATKGGYPTSQA